MVEFVYTLCPNFCSGKVKMSCYYKKGQDVMNNVPIEQYVNVPMIGFLYWHIGILLDWHII